MGEIKRFRNIRLVIYSNDHIPVHVHAISPEHEAKFSVGGGLVTLMENYGFQKRELRKIEAEITSSVDEIYAEWRRIHGDQ